MTYLTYNDKKLLLQYLCMALPYGLIVELDERFKFNQGAIPLVKELLDIYCVEGIKPYLKSMEDMTPEEEDTFKRKCTTDILYGKEKSFVARLTIDQIKWLLENHYNFILPEYMYIRISKENNPYKN